MKKNSRSNRNLINLKQKNPFEGVARYALAILSLILLPCLGQAAVVPGTSLTPVVWWDAGATNNIITDGLVTQLTDQSGGTNSAVQDGARPLPFLVTNIINGLPVLRFGGTNVLISPSGGATGNPSHSIFIVASYSTNSGQYRNGAVFYSDTASANQNSSLGVDPSTSHVWVGGYAQDNSPYVGTSITLDGAGFNILGKIYDGPTHTYQGYVAGSRDVSASAGAATYNLGNTRVGIGKQFNNGSYWYGDIAEVLVFNSALGYYDAIGVQQYLAQKYNVSLSIALPIITLATPLNFPEIGSNVVVSVSLPPNFSLSNSVVATITCDNPSVVGFSSTNFTFTPGGTNSYAFSAAVLAYGYANLTVSSAGFDGSSLSVGGVIGRSIAEVFRASDTSKINGGSVSNGDVISGWAGETNGSSVIQWGGVDNYAYYTTGATPAGTPAITFSNGSYFLPSYEAPPITNQNFSVAVVFSAKSSGTGLSSDQWFNQQGVLDTRTLAGGSDNNWGLSLSSVGTLGFGIGNPDTTVNSASGNSVVSPLYHVVVGAADTMNGQMRITVDNQPTIALAGGSTTIARTAYDMVVGGSSVESPTNYFTGQIAEIRFYNGALTSQESTNLIASLKNTYAIKYASEVVLSISPTIDALNIGGTNFYRITIPSGFNASQPVTVLVTNSSPSTVNLLGAVGNVLSVIFPAGTTNVQFVKAKGLTVGSTSLSYGSSGLTPGSAVAINVSGGAPARIAVTGGGSGKGFAPLPAYVSAVDLGGGPTVTIQGVTFNQGAPSSNNSQNGGYNYGQTAAGYGFGTTVDDTNMATMLTSFTFCFAGGVPWDGNITNDVTYQFTGLNPAKTYQVDIFVVADGGVPRTTMLQVVGATTNLAEVPTELAPNIYEYTITPDVSGNITVNWGRGTDAGVVSGIAITTESVAQPILNIQSAGLNSISISWTGSGTLYEADVVTGPWSPVAGNPGTPYTTVTTNTAKFYQLR